MSVNPLRTIFFIFLKVLGTKHRQLCPPKWRNGDFELLKATPFFASDLLGNRTTLTRPPSWQGKETHGPLSQRFLPQCWTLIQIGIGHLCDMLYVIHGVS